jgi:hypothetical protein
MELLWSLGLIVVILLALNHMAGGNPSAVLRPTSRLVSNVVGGVLRLAAGLFGSVFKIGASSMKLPKKDDHHDTRGPGPPPPRWD